jgi:hypothetical protein
MLNSMMSQFLTLWKLIFAIQVRKKNTLPLAFQLMWISCVQLTTLQPHYAKTL